MQSRWRNSMNALVCMRKLAVAALIAATAVGCSGGGSGTPFSARPPGVPLEDLHGDTPGTATRIFPDGPAVSGAINTANDRDYFRFRGNQGILYSLSTFGFPAPQPDIAFFERQEDLLIRIIQPDGFTQLLNSSGMDGGDEYDIDPAGSNPDFGSTGDHRFYFVAPSNGTFFIQFRHEQPNGVGNYRFSLSSTEQDETITEFSDSIVTSRGFTLIDDDGNLIFTGVLTGSFFDASYEIEPVNPQIPGAPITTFAVRAGVGFAIPEVFFLDAGGMLEEDPETPVVHAHVGFGHLAPGQSENLTFGEDHPFFFEIQLDKELVQAKSETTREVAVRGQDGEELDFHAEATVTPRVAKDGSRVNEFRVELAKQQVENISAEIQRSISGFEFYLDGHITTDTGLNNFAEADNLYGGSPTALWASPTWAGIANFFESDFVLDAANVVPDPGFNPNPPIRIFYDSALQMFQLAYQVYDPDLLDNPVNNFLQHAYVGEPLRVHRGGPGQVGPVILDLGPLPPNRQPPFIRRFDPFAPITDGPNVRIPIKQLTEDEVDLLRRTFYTGGFYLQIDTPNFPNGAVRAEGFLEIQLVPGDPMKDGLRAMGTVTFASDYGAGGDITVICNGKILGKIDGSMETEVWGEFWPDDYYYRAFAEDGTQWDGIVTVPGYGSAETIILSIN